MRGRGRGRSRRARAFPTLARSAATNCKLKVALFASQLEDYTQAYQIFEQVATASIDNSLTRWSVKEYLFKATLCYLCNEVRVQAARPRPLSRAPPPLPSLPAPAGPGWRAACAAALHRDGRHVRDDARVPVPEGRLRASSGRAAP